MFWRVPNRHFGDARATPRPIPGAYNVPFAAVVDPATYRYHSPDRLRELFAEVLSTAPGQVITYCGAAIAASSDAFALGLTGFDGVAIYDGSIVEWSADPGTPDRHGVTEPAKRPFQDAPARVAEV